MIENHEALVLHVALPVPVPHGFDYASGSHGSVDPNWVGCRVRVRFGPRSLIGIVIAIRPHDGVHALREIEARLDASPLLYGELWQSLHWAAQYYAHPLGEVLASALPAWLRRGKNSPTRGDAWLTLTDAGRSALATKPARPQTAAAQLWEALRDDGAAIARRESTTTTAMTRVMRQWLQRGWLMAGPTQAHAPAPLPGPTLNPAQQAAVVAVQEQRGFATFVLAGVTGSDKTEVYLQLIKAELEAGRQSLVLVPEIGLTPQLLARMQERLGVAIGVIHSGLAAGARAAVWRGAASGEVRVVLGTRSAAFVPLPHAGLIVIDEEHDTSFKQQDGFRYHARDFAIVRAHALDIPIVLGSATPSIETLSNVAQGRYRRLELPERAGDATPPTVRVLDLRGQPLNDGLLGETRAALAACLARGEQALVFRNQRGFAPVLLCHDCGWYPSCPRCSSSDTERRALIWHRSAGRLRCHHCGLSTAVPQHCTTCGGLALAPTGFGTQRLEATLAAFFPDARVVRIDADSTRAPGGLERLLAPLVEGGPALLVGTQMLAKGHDLPLLTLAVVLGVDSALTAADFRAPERFAQLLIQVSGRVGRSTRPGRVILQTHQPQHALLKQVLSGGYGAFAHAELELRRAACLPPFAAQALLRAEAKTEGPVDAFLRDALAALELADLAPGAAAPEALRAFGPLPAPQPRRAGFVRAQLLLEAPRRALLQAMLHAWAPKLYALPSARRVRWSLDVDPVDWS